jgi:hypothetical protein
MNWWDLACAFDWITPTKAFIDDARFGPPADFGVPAAAAVAGWDKRGLKQLLERHGIQVWGLIYSSDILMFAVPKNQAKWAYYVLQRAEVPMEYVPQAAFDENVKHYSFWDALLGRIPKE